MKKMFQNGIFKILHFQPVEIFLIINNLKIKKQG